MKKEVIHTEQNPFDYRRADSVWRRASPQENPYPEMRLPSPGIPADPMSGTLCRELLRQELRHTAQLLTLLEKGLAQSP